VIVAGPTGSGKSELVLRMAEIFRGEIVNCDSLQLYRGFDIGTAKTPAASRRSIPHHLIDALEPDSVYSAGEYARCARAVISAISGRAHLPIVTGGTGFYMRALLEGLPPLPARDNPLRARLNARESRRPGSLHRILKRLDAAAAARIQPTDVQKLIRALEIRVLTDRPAPARSSAEPLSGYRVLKIGLEPDRARLHAVLDARAGEMFRSGLVEEVENLLAKGCSGEEKPFESLGYKQALAVVRGKMSPDQAVASTQLETRQYAKRQMTWFRRDREIVWLSGFGAEVEGRAMELVRVFLG
jgi:tRNA dimethylallyltransferase